MAEARLSVKISKAEAARHPSVARFLSELNIPELRKMATNTGYMEVEVGIREFGNEETAKLDAEIVLRVREPGLAVPTDLEKVLLFQEAFRAKFNPPSEVKWASLNIARDNRIEDLQRRIHRKISKAGEVS